MSIKSDYLYALMKFPFKKKRILIWTTFRCICHYREDYYIPSVSQFLHETEDLLEKKNIIPSKEIRDGAFEVPLDLASIPANEYLNYESICHHKIRYQ